MVEKTEIAEFSNKPVRSGEILTTRAVSVVFATSATSVYIYLTDIADLEIGDYVIVPDKRSNHMDLGIGKVINIQPTASGLASVWILSKADDGGFLSKARVEAKLAEIEKAAEAAAKKITQQRKLADILGADDPMVQQIATLRAELDKINARNINHV